MTVDQLLAEYKQSHQNPLNKLIHIIAVPVIIFTTLAILWPLRLELLGVSGPIGYWVNGATLLSLVAVLYYAKLGWRAAAGMSVIGSLCLAAIVAIDSAGWPLLAIAGIVFVVAWIFQLYGHQVEGAKPSFFEDLQFLLVGPLFVMEELGIPARPVLHKQKLA